MDKKLELPWLDQLAFGLREGKSYKELRIELDATLKNKINGPETRRKHINVLMRIWVSVPAEHEQFRDRALTFLAAATSRERLALHWGLSLVSFELFRDVSSVIGKLLTLNDEITLAQVHSRIIEDWGDRTNLKYAVPRMLRSMVNWGVLQDTTNRGSYKPSSKIAIDDKDMKLWLLECYLTCLEQNSISVQSLNEAPALYPFAVNIKLAEMVASDRYEVSRQGLDVDVVELR